MVIDQRQTIEQFPISSDTNGSVFAVTQERIAQPVTVAERGVTDDHPDLKQIMNQQHNSRYPKVTLIMVMSANGVVAQHKIENSFEWTSLEDREQFLKRINEIGTVLMGSNTYHSIGRKPYEGIDFYVMTHRPEQFKPHKQVCFRQGSIKTVLEEIRKNGTEQLALLGGPKTNAQFLEQHLVDDIYLTIEPLIMPEGMHLAATVSRPLNLALESMVTLNESKTLLMHYRVLK